MLIKVTKTTQMLAMQVPVCGESSIHDWLISLVPIKEWLGGHYRFATISGIELQLAFGRRVFAAQGDWIVREGPSKYRTLSDADFKTNYRIEE